MPKGSRPPSRRTVRNAVRHASALPLRAIRATAGLNQTHAGLKAGMGVKRFWQIERGEGRPPSEDEKHRIARVFGVRASEVGWPPLVRDVIRPLADESPSPEV
jgi:transcriptional regulator with XRE-family HTH domain